MTVQGIFAGRLAPSVYYFSNTQDFAFAPLESMSTIKKVSVCLAGFRQVRTLQWKVWLKELLTITESKIKMASGYYLV